MIDPAGCTFKKMICTFFALSPSFQKGCSIQIAQNTLNKTCSTLYSKGFLMEVAGVGVVLILVLLLL